METIISIVNNTLKCYLEYPETYSINFDEIKRRITLTTSSQESLLFNLVNDKELNTNIEQELLTQLKNVDNSIFNVNIYTFKLNEIVITYTYGETPFELAEIGIVARLLSEYEVFTDGRWNRRPQCIHKLDELYILNKNFYNLFKRDSLWWELIKVKYPEYYKNQRFILSYKSREVLRGLHYFSNKSDERYNTRVLINMYPETFKYLIYEGIWKLESKDVTDIVDRISHRCVYDHDKEILIYMINNYDLSDKDITTILGHLLFYECFSPIFLEEIENLLKSKGKELIKRGLLKNYIDIILNDSCEPENHIEIYSWINIKLNRTPYLRDFLRINRNQVNLMNYILEGIINNNSNNHVHKFANGLNILMRNGTFDKFKILYTKCKHRLTHEEINDLIEESKLQEDKRFIQLLEN